MPPIPGGSLGNTAEGEVSGTKRKGGEISLSPQVSYRLRLEHGRQGNAARHFVRLATVALAAELSRLVGAGSGAGRVVGGRDEEHRLVDAARQARGRTVGDLDRVHRVLVVAGGAH